MSYNTLGRGFSSTTNSEFIISPGNNFNSSQTSIKNSALVYWTYLLPHRVLKAVTEAEDMHKFFAKNVLFIKTLHQRLSRWPGSNSRTQSCISSACNVLLIGDGRRPCCDVVTVFSTRHPIDPYFQHECKDYYTLSRCTVAIQTWL